MVPLIRLLASRSKIGIPISMFAMAIACAFTPSSASAAAGDLYVTDSSTGSVVIYDSDGNPTTFVTGLVNPQGITFDLSKNVYVCDAGDGAAGNGLIMKYDLSGNGSVFRSGLDNPLGIDVDGSDLLVSENGLDRVLRVPLDGIHPPSIFKLVPAPIGVTSQAAAQLGFFRYIAHETSVLEVPEDTSNTTEIPIGVGTRGVAIDESDNLFVSTDAGTIVKVLFGTTTPLAFASGFTQPTGMDFRPAKFSGDTDRVGFLYVADTGTGEISQISGTGVKSTFVADAGTPNFVAFETNAPTPTPTPTPSPTPTVSPTPTPSPAPAKALNISTRVDVETGDNVAIGGFIITGGTTPKTVIVRAIGPSLANATPPVANPLADPVLELHDSTGATIAMNDSWLDNSTADQGTIVGAGLNLYNGSVISDDEAVLVASLAPSDGSPGSGAYTAVVSGSGGGTGVGLVEVYDLDTASAEAELANISTRGLVGTGDNVMIGGVIVGPDNADPANATVVVRAIGPSLANAVPPVTGALGDPFLELHNGDGDIIQTNDNWMDGADEAAIDALGLAPTDPMESAVLANLIPGAYTAIVKGVDDTTGVGLVEVFHVPTSGAH